MLLKKYIYCILLYENLGMRDRGPHLPSNAFVATHNFGQGLLQPYKTNF